MPIPAVLLTAYQNRRLLVPWGAVPLPLTAAASANPAVVLRRLQREAALLPPPVVPLWQLPPLSILSLDPSAGVEAAFAGAGVSLTPVISRRDVPVAGNHSLLKLGGDLATRQGVILSREEVSALQSDPAKRYLLDEARRVLDNAGCLLLIGAEPANEDFRAWWSVLYPALGSPPAFALGNAPAGAIALDEDIATLAADLRANPPQPAPTPSPASASRMDQRREGLTGPLATYNRRVAALIKDISLELDGQRKVILEERLAEAKAERDKIQAELDAIDGQLQ